MNRLKFAELPRVAQITIGLTWLLLWVEFEEIVVDRQGLWKYMPLYRVGDFCIWDLSMTILIGVILFLMDRHGRRNPRMNSEGR